MATKNAIDSNKPIEVALGGTGIATATAYSVLCGGITTTNPFQSVVSLGTAGQALTSNGAAALPTWQNVSGGGGVPNYTAPTAWTTTPRLIWQTSGSSGFTYTVQEATYAVVGKLVYYSFTIYANVGPNIGSSVLGIFPLPVEAATYVQQYEYGNVFIQGIITALNGTSKENALVCVPYSFPFSPAVHGLRITLANGANLSQNSFGNNKSIAVTGNGFYQSV